MWIVAGELPTSSATMSAVRPLAKLSVIKDPTRASEKCVAKKDGKSTGSFAYRFNGHVGTEGYPWIAKPRRKYMGW